jgi:hypothetical protein
MSEGLKPLQITNWYKALVYVSGTAFLITLATQRDTFAMISLGVFIFGLGVWKDQ